MVKPASHDGQVLDSLVWRLAFLRRPVFISHFAEKPSSNVEALIFGGLN